MPGVRWHHFAARWRPETNSGSISQVRTFHLGLWLPVALIVFGCVGGFLVPMAPARPPMTLHHLLATFVILPLMLVLVIGVQYVNPFMPRGAWFRGLLSFFRFCGFYFIAGGAVALVIYSLRQGPSQRMHSSNR